MFSIDQQATQDPMDKLAPEETLEIRAEQGNLAQMGHQDLLVSREILDLRGLLAMQDVMDHLVILVLMGTQARKVGLALLALLVKQATAEIPGQQVQMALQEEMVGFKLTVGTNYGNIDPPRHSVPF